MLLGYADNVLGNSRTGSLFPVDLPDLASIQQRPHWSEDIARQAVTEAAAEYLQLVGEM